MRKALLTTLVALAASLMPGRANGLDEILKDTNPPIWLWGSVEYMSSGNPLTWPERIIVYDNASQAPLDTLIVGENTDGERISDGLYSSYLDNSLDGTAVRFKHDSDEGLKNVFFMEGDGNFSAVYNLDKDNFSAVDLFVNESVTAVPSSMTRTDLRVFPNPVNPNGVIEFSIPEEGRVTMSVYDISGRKVRDLAESQFFGEGNHKVIWDGTNERGSKIASGTYLIRLSGDYEGVSKVSVIK